MLCKPDKNAMRNNAKSLGVLLFGDHKKWPNVNWKPLQDLS